MKDRLKERETRIAVEVNCINSFYLSDYSTKLDEISRREPGTCEWVLKHPNFRSWTDLQSTPLLWLSGNPGCGKTVLSSFVIESLRNKQHSTVLYFICDNKHEQFRTRECVLRSLIHQLLVMNPSLVRHAIKHFRDMKNSMVLSASILWIIFQNIIGDGDLHDVYCILDGLDECEDESREWMMNKIHRLFSAKSPRNFRFKMLVASRPWEDIDYGLQAATRIRLKTENEEGIDHDIIMYIDSQVLALAERRHYTDKQHDSVVKALRNGANGMFLWVALIINDLQRTPISRINQRLSELPKSLHEVYNNILAKIDNSAIDRVQNILTVIVTAVRPLTLEELAIACSLLENPIAGLDSHDLVKCIRGDIELYGPIITIRLGRVNLIHQSVKDYLIMNDQISKFDPGMDLRLRCPESHTKLLDICMAYLSSQEFYRFDWAQPRNQRFIKNLEEYQLAEYSVKHWLDHFHRSADSANSPSIKRFFSLTENVRVWLEASHHFRGDFDTYGTSYWTPLHVASHLGLAPVVQYLIAKGADPNVEDLYGRTALSTMIASSWKSGTDQGSIESDVNLKITEILIKAGADINATRNSQTTSLHTAVLFHELETAKLLIKKGALVNAVTGLGNTPLHIVSGNIASKACDVLAVVKMLLEAGADTEARNHVGETPLHTARSRDTVRLLLEAGADIEAKDEYERTPLQKAALYHYWEVAQFLVDADANIYVLNAASLAKLRLLEVTENTNKWTPKDQKWWREDITHLL